VKRRDFAVNCGFQASSAIKHAITPGAEIKRKFPTFFGHNVKTSKRSMGKAGGNPHQPFRFRVFSFASGRCRD
jgi:hypothetical protein